MRPTDDHGDGRNLVTLDFQDAAKAAGIDVPSVVGNIARTLALWRGRSAGPPIQPLGMSTLATKTLATEPDRRFTLGLAYPANKADVGIAKDGFRDFVSADVLEEAAWNYLRKGARVGLLHAKGTDGAGVVVESYIYRGPDWHVKSSVITSGDWLLGVIWDQVAWGAIKTQKIRGLSPQGPVKRRIPSATALAALRSE